MDMEGTYAYKGRMLIRDVCYKGRMLIRDVCL